MVELRSAVVMVNGLPGAGKTTLARALSHELGWPLLSKDAIKESLFDSLGYSDRAWSRRIGAAAMDLLWTLLADLPGDAVIESNFAPQYRELAVTGLARGPQRQVLEVVCECPPELALTRFLARIERSERHPGHGHDDPAEGALPTSDWEAVAGQDPALSLGEVLRVDTTREVDVVAVTRWVQRQRQD